MYPIFRVSLCVILFYVYLITSSMRSWTMSVHVAVCKRKTKIFLWTTSFRVVVQQWKYPPEWRALFSPFINSSENDKSFCHQCPPLPFFLNCETEWRDFLALTMNLSQLVILRTHLKKCETKRRALLLPFKHSKKLANDAILSSVDFVAIAMEIFDVDELSLRVCCIAISLICEIVITHNLWRQRTLTKSSSHF